MTTRKTAIQRKLRIERLEKRLAFDIGSSVALPLESLIDDFSTDRSLFHDHSELIVHDLIELPKAADPLRPEDTLISITPTTLLDTFKLNSLPGANHTIYLDFDGHTTSGKAWNQSFNNGNDIQTPAYDFDGSAAFSDMELARIQAIWERVSEDFIPFQVNVTTQDPGIDRLSKSGANDPTWGVRVVIGGSSLSWWGSPAGGVAFVGSFNWSDDTPVFVFEEQLGNGNEKYTAEAISHETGHSLGLNHDGRTSPVEEYFSGHGSGQAGWAPIMGASYYQNVSQWSKGEYANASQLEDDLSIITSQNGFTYRTDDRGNTNSTAKLLGMNGSSISDWGIIERVTDSDVYTFFAAAGPMQLSVNPLDRGPNLDVSIELYDSQNNLVASSNPLSGLGATIQYDSLGSQYYLHVRGTGMGDPRTNGYSNYASLGQYFISGTLVPNENSFVSIDAGVVSKLEGDLGSTTYTFNVLRTGNLDVTSTIDYSVTQVSTNSADALDFENATLPAGTIEFLAGESSKWITVVVIGDNIDEPNEGFSVILSNPSIQTNLIHSIGSGVIENDDAAVPGVVIVTPTSGLRTREAGGNAQFDVVLDSQPTADVVISLASSDSTEGTLDMNFLRFTPSNWSIVQRVVVKGVDDPVRDGNIDYSIITGAASSLDPRFNQLDVADVQLTNVDNERGRRPSGASGIKQDESHMLSPLVDYAFRSSEFSQSFGKSDVATISRESIKLRDVSSQMVVIESWTNESSPSVSESETIDISDLDLSSKVIDRLSLQSGWHRMNGRKGTPSRESLVILNDLSLRDHG